MVNRKERRKLTCRGCGKQRVIANEEHKLCGECAAQFSEGVLTVEMLRPLRSSGRPPAGKPPVEEEEEEEDRPPAKTRTVEEPGYYCDICNNPLKRGQRKCHCGAWNDWRGTDVEEDDDIVICPRCGAVCGFIDAATDCPHCGYDGE